VNENRLLIPINFLKTGHSTAILTKFTTLAINVLIQLVNKYSTRIIKCKPLCDEVLVGIH